MGQACHPVSLAEIPPQSFSFMFMNAEHVWPQKPTLTPGSTMA
jgi:hypothetical protein